MSRIIHSPKQALRAVGTVAMEGIARLQGRYDVLRKRTHAVWQAVESSKVLENEGRKLRRICNSQSVIVFHLTREDADANAPEREQLLTTRMLRKLLPTLHRYVRRNDILSISNSSSTMLVAVLSADRAGAELAAQRLREVMMVQRIPLKHKGYTRLLVSYHAVSFAL